jgi:CO dehydrogenase/acetyl-CoA synthase alpha subunit
LREWGLQDRVDVAGFCCTASNVQQKPELASRAVHQLSQFGKQECGGVVLRQQDMEIPK